jgi:hypothetical protein
VCNDFGNNVPYSAYLEAFSQIRAPVVYPVAAPNPEPHFFEFTGTKSPKSKRKFTRAGEGWFCFAGLWRPDARRGRGGLQAPDDRARA